MNMLQTSLFKRISRRKGMRIGLIVLIIVVLLELIAPYALLQISKPDPVRTDTKVLEAFPADYDSSRARFITYPDVLKKQWNNVTMTSEAIGGEQGLYTDVIRADASGTPEHLLVITTGVHGVEGFVGSAMLDLFVQNELKSLDPEHTGLLLVHSVNPWGMKHKRRYNENNVDLNRNFIPDWPSFNKDSNTDYPKVQAFLEPKGALGYAPHHELGFFGGFAATAVSDGIDVLADALLSGQYRSPKGVYYGGQGDEPSTAYMKNLFRDALESPYANITHIDVHTGYGPRYQMSIFTTLSETMKEQEAVAAFNYPLVFTPDSEEFYATSGDISEYFYALKKKDFPDKQLYSVAFEFGTLGNGMLDSIQSVRNTVDENRLYQFGAASETTEKIVKNRYEAMFYPSETKWRLKAAEDFGLALSGVLRHRGVVE
ncbi:hypothetical protein SY83_12165 [Paenibacillus swuensis]|uniref:Peptidase M14 carboxypeptidase A domain-containing protein n=1 Tax=Paenibacillus swuensis TaxID=1178515 RepID=A0A172TIW9_9BACL|nr:M14 family metallopeptidase [Paenibacillus swuensis]ANE46906.1 hypothetical protein SY83_12165 [Paenibacillus swuensis]